MPSKIADTVLSKDEIMEHASLLDVEDLEEILRQKGVTLSTVIDINPITLSYGIKEYFMTRLCDNPDSTKSNYDITLRQFKEYIYSLFGYDPIMEDITPSQIQSFLDQLSKADGNDIQIVTLIRKLATIRSLFRFAHVNNYISQNTARLVHQRNMEELLPVALNSEEAIGLLDIAGKTRNPIRDQALIATFLYTGARIGEVNVLEVRDVNFKNRTIRLFGKGEKERIVPLLDDLYPYLAGYVREWGIKNKPNQQLFEIRRRRIQQLIENLSGKLSAQFINSPKKITPHTLRHTFAVTCLLSGIHIETIRQLLGHKYLTTTQRYTKLNINQKRAILNKYFNLEALSEYGEVV